MQRLQRSFDARTAGVNGLRWAAASDSRPACTHERTDQGLFAESHALIFAMVFFRLPTNHARLLFLLQSLQRKVLEHLTYCVQAPPTSKFPSESPRGPHPRSCRTFSEPALMAMLSPRLPHGLFLMDILCLCSALTRNRAVHARGSMKTAGEMLLIPALPVDLMGSAVRCPRECNFWREVSNWLKVQPGLL
jgi:hypothetical protein